MDLIKIINDLRNERDKLQAIISSLEQLHGASPSHSAGQSHTSRRGRRSMDAEGRLEVSRRMKQYWENRRKEGDASRNTDDNGHSMVDSIGA